MRAAKSFKPGWLSADVKRAAERVRAMGIEQGVMVCYDPRYGVWVRPPFDGCFGDCAGTMSNWVVPGTWPRWML